MAELCSWPDVRREDEVPDLVSVLDHRAKVECEVVGAECAVWGLGFGGEGCRAMTALSRERESDAVEL